MPEPIQSYEFASDGRLRINGEDFPWEIADEVIATRRSITVSILCEPIGPPEVEEALVDARQRLRERAGRG